MDAALELPLDVVVIGRAAAAVQYGVEDGTHDIDTRTNVQAELAHAVEEADRRTGL